MVSLGRRPFLRAAGAMVSVLFGGAFTARAVHGSSLPHGLPVDVPLRDLFPLDPTMVHAFACEYAQQRGGMPSRDLLRREAGLAAGLGPAALRERVARRRARDWRTGNTVILGGWIVARSEAALCSLVALS